jgi:hypothetical protein
MNTNELHAAVMNLKCRVLGEYADADWCDGYREGHCDARQAAASLVLVNRENVNAELLAAAKRLVAVREAQSKLADSIPEDTKPTLAKEKEVAQLIWEEASAEIELEAAIADAESILPITGQSDV